MKGTRPFITRCANLLVGHLKGVLVNAEDIELIVIVCGVPLKTRVEEELFQICSTHVTTAT